MIKPRNNLFLNTIGSLFVSLMYLFSLNKFLIISTTLFFFLIIVSNNIKEEKNFIILQLLLFCLPFSYIAIIGDSFFSLFIIFQTFFVLINLFQSNNSSKIKVKSLIVLIFIMINIIYFIGLSLSSEILYETIIKTNLFVLTALTALDKINFSEGQNLYLKKLYLISTMVASITVFVQYFFYHYLGIIDLGTQSLFGEYRIGFSGLFFDYSIVSIYISSGALFLVCDYLDSTKRIFDNSIIYFLLSTFLLTASVLTSARSGIAAFLITLGLYLIYKRKMKLIFLGILLGGPIIYFLLNLLTINRANGLVDDSGRFTNFQNAINFIVENPLLGSSNLGYEVLTNNLLPHNFILDILVNNGLFIGFLFIILLFVILKKGYRKKRDWVFLYIVFLSGALFHASFFNTHYLIIPLIVILGKKENNIQIDSKVV